jgi:hypothetical protein
MSIRFTQTAHDHIPEEFSVDDLKESGFTDEEIAALATGDDEDPPLVTIEAEGDDEPDAADPGDEEIAPGTAPKEEEQAAKPAPEPEIPEIEIPDTTDAEKVVAELDQKLDELQTRYDDGELTRAEFAEQNKALIAEQAKAQMLIERATAAIGQQKQTVEQRWFATQEAYYAANNAADLLSDAHVQHWDRHLREVTANPALSKLTFDQMIRLAHTRYAAEYEAINGKPLPIAVPKAGSGGAKLAVKPEAERPEAIQTLATVNGDLSDAISDSRAAALDRLAATDPLIAEQQIAAMGPEAEERWLRGA